MKFKTTYVLAAITLIFAAGIYLLDYRKELESSRQTEVNTQIVSFKKDQINFIEIQKDQNKIVLQKSPDGWAILEPVQDSADNDQVEGLLDVLTAEKYLTVAKESADPKGLKLNEFGLEPSYAIFNLKNNLGHSQKIFLGSQKNFEGNTFLRLDTENKILVGNPVWLTKADQNVMTYREKRLYRSPLGKVVAVYITSLQDKFDLKRVDNKWVAVKFPQYSLDQNKVRNLLKQIAETSVIDYVFDGEPSTRLVQEKKLIKAPVAVSFDSPKSTWSVVINQNEKDNAVYAMTNRPTNLLKIDSSRWELFGNLNLDSLRERASQFRFSLNDVSKIYYKDEKNEFNFTKNAEGAWSALQSPEKTEFSALELAKLLGKIHDLEVSEFLDSQAVKLSAKSLAANRMIILKSAADNLIMQFNWGPELKLTKNGRSRGYYYARTSLGDNVFAMDQEAIASINLAQVFKPKEN